MLTKNIPKERFLKVMVIFNIFKRNREAYLILLYVNIENKYKKGKISCQTFLTDSTLTILTM